MKFPVLLPVLLALVLVGCAPDRTLDTLFPREALAVALAERPADALPALGPGGRGLPLGALDPTKPWGAAVVPDAPPGFLLALALADRADAWPTVEAWARTQGGLVPYRAGTYAVLASPGTPFHGPLDGPQRFDLARVRAGGDALALYLDVANLAARTDLPPALQPAFGALPWARAHLAGLRIGVRPRMGGLEWRLATDGRLGSPVWPALRAQRTSVDLVPWTGLLPADHGLGLVAAWPPGLLPLLASGSGDRALVARAEGLDGLVGPRVALTWSAPPGGQAAWQAVVESTDPQALRQALKSLVAGGDLQRNFASWSLDPDTPLIYRDLPNEGGAGISVVSLGSLSTRWVWEGHRVTVSSGPGPGAGTRPGAPIAAAPWAGEVPGGSSLVAAGRLEDLGARAAGRILDDGNLELRVWVGAADLRAWEERLPQALLTWLSGEGGWTRWEP